MSPFARSVSDYLASFWGTQPNAICAYSRADVLSGAFGPCGSLAANNALFCPRDVSIAYEVEFLDQVSAQVGVFASVAIYAHEWGHLNQHALGLLGEGSTKPIELHADCLMGVFMAYEEQAGRVGLPDVMGTFQTFCALGDPVASPWFAPGAHGTCLERTEAVRLGYAAARAEMSSMICERSLADAARTYCGSILGR